MKIMMEVQRKSESGLNYATQQYYAYADKEDNENVKGYLENLGNSSLAMSNFYIGVAENAENRAQTYYDAYEEAIALAVSYGKAADYRSTGALIFNIAAIIASCGILFRRKEILYASFPIFVIGVFYFILSLT